MKCKFGIVSIMLAGLALTATAQTKEKYYSEKFKDNIFISAGVGAQACVNPDNFDYGFGHAITPLIHVSVGKLFNPIWGVRGQVAGLWSTLYTERGQIKGAYAVVKMLCITCLTLFADIIRSAYLLYLCSQVPD